MPPSEGSANNRSVQGHFDRAVALERAGRLEEAVGELEQAAKRDPNSGDVHINLAALLEKVGRLEESVPIARRATELCPHIAIAHYNLGKVLQSCGRLDEAISAYSDAIRLDASFALAYTNRGCCRLLAGDYRAGWSDYEWRLRTPQVQIDQYPQSRWDGRTLSEGTLVIHGEQGIGDEIQFASCVPDVVPLVQRTVLVCQPRLAKLLARSFPAAAVVAHERTAGRVPPQFRIAIDAQIASGSLPMFVRPSIDAFPRRRSYLLADPDEKRRWRKAYAGLGPGLKVGISWFGGGTWEERRLRTTALSLWRELFAVPGVEWINLQYGNCAEALAIATKEFGRPIHHFDDANPLGDLDAFAAKVAALDMVISIGNATVHLAGALGLPTWCIVPYVPQWRWGFTGERTPWYPSVRIFRQPKPGDWQTALSAAAVQLREVALPGPNDSFAAAKHAALAPPIRPAETIRAACTNSIASNQSIPAPANTVQTKRSSTNISLKSLVQKATQLFSENRIEEATRIAEHILAADSNSILALRILAVAARIAKQFDKSLEYYARAISVNGGSSVLHFEQGVTYADMKRHREAYECFLKATQLQPPYQPAFVNVSAILEQQERYEESLQWARKAVEIKADCPLAHYNLANSLRECGRISEAIAHYELAVKYRPDYAKAKWNLGIAHVLLGHYAQAWPLFELRDVAEEVKLDQYPQPRWDGSPLAGKTIVVHAEQGIGDEVLFASCFDDVIAQAGKTILVCEPRLKKLFARSFPRATVHAWARRKDWSPMPLSERVDFQIPAGSLPLYFRNRAEDFPKRERFLVVEPGLLKFWKERFFRLGNGLKIGISWRAGGKANEGRKRTIELLDWREILTTPNVSFVNLQYGDTVDDVDRVRTELGVHILDWEQGDPLVDMDSYAAKIAALDLVISVGNAAVHLAGAVGTPAWTLLPRVPSWRWMVDGDFSPWYSSVKLFRQPRRREWGPVIGQIAHRLREVALAAQQLSANAVAAQIRAVRPQNAPPEAAEISAPPRVAEAWLDEKELSSRRPLEVIAALQDEAERALAAKHYVEAERICREILQITPRHAKAHASLGVIARETGRLDHAVRCFQRALGIVEPHAANQASLAETLADLGRAEEALAHAQRAYQIDAKLPQAQHAFGRALQMAGQHAAAAKLLQSAVAQDPTDVAAICAWSRALVAAGQMDQAIDMLRAQIAKTPNESRLHLALGETLLEDRWLDEAEAALRRAIELQPSLALAHLKLSQVLEGSGNLAEAIVAARRALDDEPQCVDAMLHLGAMLRQINQPADAETLYRRAVELRPQSVAIFNQLGMALIEQSRPLEAIREFDKALEIQPNHAATRMNRACALLASGRFAEGWDEYEWRWRSDDAPLRNWTFGQPPWDGSSLAGRSLLIYPEQSLTEELMFATCYPQVVERSASATVVCDARLERLFRRSFPQAQVIGVPQGAEHGWRPPHNATFDVQCASGSLPKLLRRGVEEFPRQIQFLKPAAEKVRTWRECFKQFGRTMKIGIAWRGEGARQPSSHNIALENWQPILSTKNVTAISLQHSAECRRDIADFKRHGGETIVDFSEADHRFDLDGLAAKIAALDLVITVDGFIAHLAGALGIPTWVLLAPPVNWFWQCGAEESLWYGAVRLFRSGKLQHWDEVFRQLRHELFKTTFRLDEESSRERLCAPHWSSLPVRSKP